MINESKKETYQPIIHHSSEGHYAIRQGDWKMIEKLGSGGFSLPKTIDPMTGDRQERLYNMREDLTEQINLADDYPKIITEMKYKLDSIRSISIN